jgi:hypothetical protein
MHEWAPYHMYHYQPCLQLDAPYNVPTYPADPAQLVLQSLHQRPHPPSHHPKPSSTSVTVLLAIQQCNLALLTQHSWSFSLSIPPLLATIPRHHQHLPMQNYTQAIQTRPYPADPAQLVLESLHEQPFISHVQTAMADLSFTRLFNALPAV